MPKEEERKSENQNGTGENQHDALQNFVKQDQQESQRAYESTAPAINIRAGGEVVPLSPTTPRSFGNLSGDPGNPQYAFTVRMTEDGRIQMRANTGATVRFQRGAAVMATDAGLERPPFETITREMGWQDITNVTQPIQYRAEGSKGPAGETRVRVTREATTAIKGPDGQAIELPVNRATVLGRDRMGLSGEGKSQFANNHAALKYLDDGLYIEDMGSKHGTHIEKPDGTRQPVTGRVLLQRNDKIWLGEPGHPDAVKVSVVAKPQDLGERLAPLVKPGPKEDKSLIISPIEDVIKGARTERGAASSNDPEPNTTDRTIDQLARDRAGELLAQRNVALPQEQLSRVHDALSGILSGDIEKMKAAMKHDFTRLNEREQGAVKEALEAAGYKFQMGLRVGGGGENLTMIVRPPDCEKGLRIDSSLIKRGEDPVWTVSAGIVEEQNGKLVMRDGETTKEAVEEVSQALRKPMVHQPASDLSSGRIVTDRTGKELGSISWISSDGKDVLVATGSTERKSTSEVTSQEVAGWKKLPLAAQKDTETLYAGKDGRVYAVEEGSQPGTYKAQELPEYKLVSRNELTVSLRDSAALSNFADAALGFAQDRQAATEASVRADLASKKAGKAYDQYRDCQLNTEIAKKEARRSRQEANEAAEKSQTGTEEEKARAQTLEKAAKKSEEAVETLEKLTKQYAQAAKDRKSQAEQLRDDARIKIDQLSKQEKEAEAARRSMNAAQATKHVDTLVKQFLGSEQIFNERLGRTSVRVDESARVSRVDWYAKQPKTGAQGEQEVALRFDSETKRFVEQDTNKPVEEAMVHKRVVIPHNVWVQNTAQVMSDVHAQLHESAQLPFSAAAGQTGASTLEQLQVNQRTSSELARILGGRGTIVYTPKDLADLPKVLQVAETAAHRNGQTERERELREYKHTAGGQYTTQAESLDILRHFDPRQAPAGGAVPDPVSQGFVSTARAAFSEHVPSNSVLDELARDYTKMAADAESERRKLLAGRGSPSAELLRRAQELQVEAGEFRTYGRRLAERDPVVVGEVTKMLRKNPILMEDDGSLEGQRRSVLGRLAEPLVRGPGRFVGIAWMIDTGTRILNASEPAPAAPPTPIRINGTKP